MSVPNPPPAPGEANNHGACPPKKGTAGNPGNPPYTHDEAAPIVLAAARSRARLDRSVEDRLPRWWQEAALDAHGLGEPGVDAYVLEHGDDATRAAWARAKLGANIAGAGGAGTPEGPPTSGAPGPSPAGDGPTPNEARDDPHRLARNYLEARCTHPDGATIVYHMGDFHRWGGAYRPVVEKEVRAELGATIKAEFDRLNLLDLAAHRVAQSGRKPPETDQVTCVLVNNVVAALASLTCIDGRIQAPAWLDGRATWAAPEVLPTRNGLLHLPSFVAGRSPSLVPPTPAFFCPYATDYDFDPAAPSPSAWLAFLEQIFEGDAEAVASLQEWFGYHLTPDTSQQKIAMLIGPRRCGKGTLARVLTALVGATNVCNPKLSALGQQFGLAVLIGKLAAIVTDARINGRADISQIVENLLTVSGEDGQSIPRKNRADWEGRIAAKFTIVSNETPRLMDTSNALTGRMIMFRLRRSYFGQEDPRLLGRLLPELPGILLWAIEGWRRLNERGHFVQPESGRALVEEMEELASPVGTFIKERCTVGPDLSVETKVLFSAWREYCREINRDHVGQDTIFGRDLRAALPEVERKRIRQRGRRDETPPWFYTGIDLNSPGPF